MPDWLEAVVWVVGGGWLGWGIDMYCREPADQAKRDLQEARENLSEVNGRLSAIRRAKRDEQI